MNTQAKILELSTYLMRPPSKAHRFARARASLCRYLSARSTACPEVFEAKRVPVITTLLANASWWMPTPALEVLADVGLAIFAFDDLVDEGGLELDALERRMTLLLALLDDAPCPPSCGDPIADLIAELGARLREAPGGAELWSAWADSFRSCFVAILDNRRVAELGAPIELDAYLEIGRESVGVITVGLAAALLVGDARVLEQRDGLVRALEQAATAVRIANDLRTIERERSEQTTNALMLPGTDVASLRARAHAARRSCAEILAQLELGRVARFVLDFCDALLALYDVGDFREGSAATAGLRVAG